MIRLRENLSCFGKLYSESAMDKHMLDVVDSIHYSYGVIVCVYTLECLTAMTLFMIS